MAKKLKNYTPHDITFVDAEGVVVRTLTPDCSNEQLPRVTVSSELVGEIEGYPLYRSVFGEPVNLPEPEEDTVFIVSNLVKEAAKLLGRTDFVAPRTVRNDKGQILGCNGFDC